MTEKSAKVLNDKIVGYKVKKPGEPQEDVKKEVVKGLEPIEMNEALSRPEFLRGTTYRMKPPVVDNAMYITINDVILNKGTEFESIRPFEIFINSRDVQHLQWVNALTLILSATFRKGGDIAFIAEELRSVYDPNGGYFKKGGVYMNSIVAEIGYIIEQHFKSIGLIKSEGMSEEVKALLAEKRAQAKDQNDTSDESDDGGYPPSATVCPKCHTKAVIMVNGCNSCLSCGDSKCS